MTPSRKIIRGLVMSPLKNLILATTYSPGPEGRVPSALKGLTAVFGMGTGVTPSL